MTTPNDHGERDCPDQDLALDGNDPRRQEELNTLLESFSRLVQTAADAGRDWKLVDAILRAMIELALQSPEDLLVPTETEPDKLNDTDGSDAPSKDEMGRRRLRLRPQYRLRFEAIIDSWSDDEVAGFLLIGTRQVRRFAQQGVLYYFLVNRKRRYPVWQFDRFYGVLGGVAEVARSFPEAWMPERVYEFMTTRSAGLGQITPAQALLANRDPSDVSALIAEVTEG